MGSSEKQRLKHLLVETIQVLCKNSLPNESSFCVEATIGITLSDDHVMLVSFKERINADGSHMSLMITDERDSQSQEQQGKNSDTKKGHHKSYSSYNNNVQHAISETPTGCQRSELPQTHSSSWSVSQQVGIHENNVVDGNELLSTRVPLSGNTDHHSLTVTDHCSLPITDHRSLPLTDECYTASQSPADHAMDSKDDVVIVKVEEGSNNSPPVSGVQQFDAELAASPVQCVSAVTNQTEWNARFAANMLHSSSGQATSALLETNEMHRIDGSHQQITAFDVS